MEVLFGIALIVVGLAIYFLPALVAKKRRHPHVAAILVVNIFFGWTLLGWVGCLAWSLIQSQPRVASTDR